MQHLVSRAIAVAALAVTGAAGAADFSPDFSDYPFPGTQYDVDAPANTFFYDNYGITIDNAYLYVDSRDTFDGIGIANGWVSANYVPDQTARVDFIDLTDFVTIDYLAILETTYNAYSSSGDLLASFTSGGGSENGTFTLNGGSAYIAYVTFNSTGGFGTISGLTYNYDGDTGGGGGDLPPVPEPETYALMLAGLAMVAGLSRRRRNRNG